MKGGSIVTPPGGCGESDEWVTPDCLFDVLDGEFSFTFDAAATATNTKCTRFSSDSLDLSWSGETVWLNPPYSQLRVFMEKAAAESRRAVVVALVPLRCDTAWWHLTVRDRCDELRLLEGRPYFKRQDGRVGPAPFAAGVVIYRPMSTRGLLRYVPRLRGRPWKDLS